MKIRNTKLAEYILNILTSGRYANRTNFSTSDYLIKYVLLNFTIIAGSIVLGININYELRRGEYINAIAFIAMMVVSFATFFFARTKTKQFIPAVIVMSFFCLFLGRLTWISQTGTSYQFIYIYPSLAIMLLGVRWGAILSTVLLVITSILMFIPGIANYNYYIVGSFRMLSTYILILGSMIIIEFTRKTKDKLIKKQGLELENFNKNLQNMVEEKTQHVLTLQNILLKTMVELVEYRDHITGGHIERTQNGVKIILNEMRESEIYLEEIKDLDIDLLLLSCQLHDIGKIGINDNILKKPGKLNKDEFEEMKRHAELGKKIIEKIILSTKENDFLKYAKIFASSHHEKWDGSGYPYGLIKQEIPVLGRIMAIADVYDALTSIRSYKNALCHEEAVQIIIDNSGTQFDPILVNILVKTEKRFREYTQNSIL